MRYETYKDSGTEWIGEIPEHWEIRRLGYSFKIIGSGTTPNTNNQIYYNGNNNWLLTGDLNDGLINTTSRKISDDAMNEFSTLRKYNVGAVVIAMYGATIGRLGLLNIESTTNQACCVLDESEVFENKFVFYWFLSNRNHIINLSYGGGQPNISQNLIRNLKLQRPLIEEQTAIANYLDRKTAEIDNLITKKEKLLKLYEEEKTAVINQAVTKGLTADYERLNDYHDETIKSTKSLNQKNQRFRQFKDSGIEWLGSIPEHWEVKKFKYYFNLITEKNQTNGKKIGLENIESKSGKFIETDSEFEGEGISFVIDDILFGKLRPYLAKVFLAKFEGKAVGDFFVFRSKGEILPEFGSLRLLDYSFIDVTNSSTYGAKMPRVNWEFIANLEIAFPTTKEQTAIVAYIEKETARIDVKIEKTKKLINLLKEYRTALISEAVTGKIKVS